MSIIHIICHAFDSREHYAKRFETTLTLTTTILCRLTVCASIMAIIAVAGGLGQVGRTLVDGLVQHGHKVLVLSRKVGWSCLDISCRQTDLMVGTRKPRGFHRRCRKLRRRRCNHQTIAGQQRGHIDVCNRSSQRQNQSITTQLDQSSNKVCLHT